MSKRDMTPMSVEDWIAVPDNPRQRDTERHALLAIEWLAEPKPPHRIVHAAQLPSGKLFKLDGHTRAHLWDTNQIKRPADLGVVVYAVADKEGAAELYPMFDNTKAAEKATDQVFGAMRQMGFEPHSDLVRRCRLLNALKTATMFDLGVASSPVNLMMSNYEVVQRWQPELTALDEDDMPRPRMSGPLIVAYVMSVRKHGAEARAFWAKFKAEDAQRVGRQRDGVAALIEVCAQTRRGSSTTQINRMCGMALSCIEAYLAGEYYLATPRVTRPELYFHLGRKTVAVARRKRANGADHAKPEPRVNA